MPFISHSLYLRKLFTMKYLFSGIFFLFSFCVWGQIYAVDSLSGGEYHIETSSELDSLVSSSIKATCSKTKSIMNNENNSDIDVCARTPKVLGYKIQILYTKDRSIAERTLTNFNRNYPDLMGEMQYSRPDYRVLVGDFFTKRSAAIDLSRVKKAYPGAMLVQWRVFCRRAK